MELTRISSCTYPLREKPAFEALQIMRRAGVRKVDLWGNLPHFSIMSASCNLQELQQQAQAVGVQIANIGSYPGRAFASDNPFVREAELAALHATLYAAKALGARSIRVMPGQGEDPAQIERIAPYFAQAAELAEKLNVYMGMENHAGSLAGLPEYASALCRAVGSPYFGVLYEPANLLHKGVDYKKALEIFHNHIVHIHVKDGKIGAEGFVRTHLGEGDIDYPWIIENLESLGYKGDYALEYEMCDIEPIETALPRWLAYFQSL